MPSHSSIERALRHVLSELHDLGLLTRALHDVPVYTQAIDVGLYEGLYVEEPHWLMQAIGFEARAIYVPRRTWAGLAHDLLRLGRRPSSMRDVLRHELGHAFAVAHPSLVRRCRAFRAAFGAPYDGENETDHDPNRYVTEYASSSPSEDFAEIFMTYVRQRGRVGRYRSRPGVYRKLQFVSWLRHAVQKRRVPLVDRD